MKTTRYVIFCYNIFMSKSRMDEFYVDGIVCAIRQDVTFTSQQV